MVRKLQVAGRFGGVDVSRATVGQTITVKAIDENGNPTEWEAVDLPKQVQGDWNQNDPCVPDFVKGRTHYETTEYEEMTVTVGHGIGLSRTVRTLIYEQRATAKFEYQSVEFHIVEDFGLDQNGAYVFKITNGVNVFSITIYPNEQVGSIYVWDSVGNCAIAGMQVTYLTPKTKIHKLDAKYLPDDLTSPLLLDADSAETYLNGSDYGDEALEAIKTGRKILVKVPNADGGSYTAIYSPVLMYQVPNWENQYLYLFFLRDEKQDLSDSLGLPAGSVLMPTYSQLKMLLSQKYNSNPLES